MRHVRKLAGTAQGRGWAARPLGCGWAGGLRVVVSMATLAVSAGATAQQANPGVQAPAPNQAGVGQMPQGVAQNQPPAIQVQQRAGQNPEQAVQVQQGANTIGVVGNRGNYWNSDGQQYWFGVAVENITPAVAKQLKLLPEQGVMVVEAFGGSPAEKAGIRAEDLLIEINGKALTSQDELARAANSTLRIGIAKGAADVPQTIEVTLLREGEKKTVKVKPEPRPADMRVTGDNNFNYLNTNPVTNNNFKANNDQQQLQPNGGRAANDAAPRNMLLPNGANVQYGPGYQVDAQSPSSRVLRDAVGKGNGLIITQYPDASGNVKQTISDGNGTFVVDRENVDKMPANLRPLAERLMTSQTGTVQTEVGKAAAPVNTVGTSEARKDETTTEERLKRLEAQNEELKRALDEVKKLLLQAKDNGAAGK
jgi:hypothetical protein